MSNDLQEQFLRFIKDFNDMNDSKLEKKVRDDAEKDLSKVLDDHVLIVGIDRPRKHTYKGVPKVVEFMKESGGHFDPLDPSFFRVVGQNGYVMGIGKWSDKGGDVNAPILISFIFVNRDADNPNWKAMRLWGSHPLGEVKDVDP